MVHMPMIRSISGHHLVSAVSRQGSQLRAAS
jgi:hypothetical protein